MVARGRGATRHRLGPPVVATQAAGADRSNSPELPLPAETLQVGQLDGDHPPHHPEPGGPRHPDPPPPAGPTIPPVTVEMAAGEPQDLEEHSFQISRFDEAASVGSLIRYKAYIDRAYLRELQIYQKNYPCDMTYLGLVR